MLEMWNNASVGRRVGLVMGVVMILSIPVVYYGATYQRDFSVLYTELNAQDAASVVEELQAMKIDYQLQDAGSTVLVDANQQNEARLQLASSGITVNGGAGFELFDNADYGMTEFSQKINYQRAMQGELSRTISTFNEVSYARVHLVMPEQSLFQKDSQEPKATVTLAMNGESGLDTAQIQGIQSLVAGSVEGLVQDQVTVLNQQGQVMSRTQGDEVFAVSGQLQQKQSMEQYLAGKVRAILDSAVGVGQGVVNVDATLNFDRVRRTTEEVLPVENGKGVLVRDKTQKRFQEAKPKNKKKTTSSNTQLVDLKTDVVYEVGKSVEEKAEAPGRLQRLSVSVLLPGEAGSERIYALKPLIAAAVGIDESRGDTLEVRALPILPRTGVSASNFDEVELVSADGAISNGSNADPSQESLSFGFWVMSPWLLLITAFIGLVVVMLVIQTRPRQKRLSGMEREVVLQEVQEWLKTPGASS